MISSWARNTFQTFGNRNYRILWIGSTAAFLAFMMSSIVQSVVAFDITGKNGAVGFVALGMGVATVAIAPFGGVIADRVSKRMLVLIGQSLIGLNFIVVGVLILTDNITIAALAGSTFVLGTVFSFIGPARQAWIGELVTNEELPNAIALQQVGMTMTRVAGPFVAAGLIAMPMVGTGGTYIFMGGLFVFVIGTLFMLPATKGRKRGEGPGVLQDLRLGVGHIAGSPRRLLLALSFMGIIIGGFSYQVVLPGFIENELGKDPDQLIGLFFGVSAIAGLVVTIGIAGLSGTKHSWRIMLACGMVLGLSLVAFAFCQNLWIALLVMLPLGAGSSGFQLLNSALLMQESEPAYYGRVMSISMLGWGLNGLAGFPFGLFADATSEPAALVLMGAIVALVTAAAALAYAAIIRREEGMIAAPAGASVAATD